MENNSGGYRFSQNKGVGKRKFALIFILILIIIPAALFFLKQPKNVPPPVVQKQPEAGVLAEVGGQKITEKDLEAAIRAAYGDGADEALKRGEVRKVFLDGLIKKKLIEIESQKKKLSVSQTDLQNTYLTLLGSGQSFDGNTTALLEAQTVNPDALKNRAEQELLENNVVTWRLIDMVSDYKNIGDTLNREKAKKSLQEIRKLLISNLSMREAYEEAKKQPGFDTAGAILSENKRAKQPFWSKDDIKFILPLHKGDISEVLDIGGGTYILVKVLDENNTDFATFDEWLAKQNSSVQRK